jgi:hypothetical protein
LNLESLIKNKLQEDGAKKAEAYVEQRDVLLPEEEIPTGEDKEKTKVSVCTLSSPCTPPHRAWENPASTTTCVWATRCVH